jgi:hypothetical protein
LATETAKSVCSRADCTVAATGICILGRPSPQECEHYGLQDEPAVPAETEKEKVTEVLQEGRSFHVGAELGTSDIHQISGGSYPHIIGVMGPFNAGKTCFLLSLYLMASRQLLPESYLFRRSLTLQGFEDRARKLREWSGGPLPEELADHTVLQDPRQPGFLHLGFLRKGEPVDLFFSDVPGEWTTSLAKSAEMAHRWDFLRRADGIIIVVDGEELIGEDCYVHVTTAKHVLQRLKESVHIEATLPLVILVAKGDKLEMKQPPLLEEIIKCATGLGFHPKIVLCASFSRKPKVVESGAGVIDAIEYIVDPQYSEEQLNQQKMQNSRSAGELRFFHFFGMQK